MALELTPDNFEIEVLQSEQPVLVDFWAEWCGPCKMIAPMINALSAEVEGVAKVGKINVDQAQDLARTYGIQSIPSLLVFKGGKVVETIVGANVTQDSLKEKLEAHA